MKWRCALTQRWLAAYLDGDLPAFRRERLRSHLEGCPACREELAELAEVVKMVKAAAVPEPEPQFWQDFNQQLHLKLAQSVPEPPPSRVWKLPYLVGAPALAALLIWIAVGYLSPERPGLAPKPQMAKQTRALQERAKEKMVAKPRLAPPAPETRGEVAFVAQNGEEMPPDDDLMGLRGDLDSTLAGMTEQEKEAFLKKLRQHDKDGSCLGKISAIYWA